MRKTYQTILATGLLSLIFGCSSPTRTIQKPEAENYPVGEVTVRGKPLSVYGNTGQSKEYLSTVVYIGNKPVLATAMRDCSNEAKEKNTEAIALIQSEIADSDEEEIEMTGEYKDGKFLIKRLKANGYEMDFKCEW